ncbi:NTP transferase domain-containing protein [Agromyces intestinalis]|uniref:NTP transferase domain-containing protein n=1 Tax=Agromyces intestinalis TaxID=2592652 RepID=A0A5C1YC81_9MICO|nr:NTP transferase domain-containing protein [Agromyces intestinalis]QEO13704.1 NTP transferase domain-containing protein [Agromyces intestinalis]
MTHAPGPSLAALVLAGGRARRLDGADKPGLRVGSARLVDHAVAAARALGADPIVVVGPPGIVDPDATVRVVREDPPFGGPVAAIAAGLRELEASEPDLTVLLAADLPRAQAAAALLRPWIDAADRTPDPKEAGAVLVDAGGRDQWLAGVYRTAGLRERLATLSEAGASPHGAALGALVGALALARIPDEGESADIDTWDDLDSWRARLGTLEASADPAGHDPARPEEDA